jgi:hypothetical protein
METRTHEEGVYVRFLIALDKFQRELSLPNSAHTMHSTAASRTVQGLGDPGVEIQPQFFQLLISPDEVDDGRWHRFE